MDTTILTDAQQLVFGLLIQGKTNVEIGEALQVREKTVKSHVTEIFKKLKCKSRAQVIARYYMKTASVG